MFISCVAKFLTKENLLILHENIDHLASGQSDLYKPIRSKMETPLTSPSLRHFVWNIGEYHYQKEPIS